MFKIVDDKVVQVVQAEIERDISSDQLRSTIASIAEFIAPN